jgi:pilus assembly protein Flp/PilA
MFMFGRIKQFVEDNSGATAIEYGLIAALIFTGFLTVLSITDTELKAVFADVASGLRSGHDETRRAGVTVWGDSPPNTGRSHVTDR